MTGERLPELVRRRAERLLKGYCARPRPRQPGDGQLRFLFEGACVTLWLGPSQSRSCSGQPFAQLRFHEILSQWTLHYRDRQGHWVLYLNCAPALDLAKLLGHLDADPLRHFWP